MRKGDPMNDYTKLPKWAQKEIENLTRSRDYAIRELQRYLDNQTPSPVYNEQLLAIAAGDNRYAKQYIQSDEIVFDLGGKDGDRRNEIHVRLKNGELYISSSFTSFTALSIRPSCANVVVIRAEKL